MKHWLLIAGVVLGAGGAVLITQWLQEVPVTTEAASQNIPNDDSSLQRYSNLEKQLNQIHARLQELATKQSNLSQAQQEITEELAAIDARTLNVIEPSNQSESDNSIVESEYDEEIEEAKFQEQRRQAMATLEQQFSAEELDETWSAQAMEQITQVSELPEVEGTTLSHLECRSTMCQLQTNHKDQQALNEYAQVLSMTLQWDNTLTMRVVDNADGTKTSMMFISRDGYDLEY